MQEEVDQKTIALAVKTGKLTAQVLQAAIRKYLAARQKIQTGSRLPGVWLHSLCLLSLFFFP